MRLYKKYLYLILFMVFLMTNVNAASVYSTYDIAMKNTDTYITKFNKYNLFIDSNNKYFYNGSALSKLTGFINGGFLNKYEFDTSLDSNNDSYLITGSRYWTMTGSNNLVYYLDIRKLNRAFSNDSLESRITELIIPETMVTGTGSHDNPWVFVVPEFKITINIQNASINGNKTINETIVGYNKTYSLTPDQSYYIFKNKDGDLVCDNTIGSYKIVDNKLILDDLKGNGSCTIKYRGMDVVANIVATNGTSQSTKLTGEAGDTLSAEVNPNNGYAYDSISCTNSQNGSYSSKKLTITNITKDTTCTVTYGKPNSKTFTFVASEQTYNVEYSGYYILDSYGAQGENGGKGAKATGTIYLNKGDILTINTGGAGSNSGSSKGYNGGGSGQYYGGGASTVKRNGTILIAAAGGGGGVNGTDGGTGSGKGGASVGAGEGASGTNAGGGGSSYDYHYQANCSNCYYGSNTCTGGYISTNCSSCHHTVKECQGAYESYTYGSSGGSVCTTCVNGSYGSTYDSTNNVNCGSDQKVWSCGSWPTCGNSGSVCKSCSGYCVGQKYNSCASYSYQCVYGCDETYSACATGSNTCSYGCDNLTKNYLPGNGGTNIFSSALKNVSENYGSRTSDGEVTISFHGEDL